ncbi:sideroflexin-2 [Camponotus floridanus]|uniref:sideroflexin-2 n=1 Tax=Camponotus floridanus TaxID=104421 RepID=UPI000DC6782C|nr:sideroflexin-2 [Camponotus floridanus]
MKIGYSRHNKVLSKLHVHTDRILRYITISINKEPEDLRREDIIYAKKLRDSAFHPDNGEFMHVIGRMSFQLPSSVALTAAMLTFYKSAYGVIACQLVNQGFNAFVNYTNRNAMNEDPQDTNVIQAFILATAASCAAALGFRKLYSGRGTLFARFVPFCAVAAGNIVNLPIMRQREIMQGIPIFIKNENEVCIMKSQVAAVKGISECIFTRIIMAAPGMLMIPIITQRMQPYCFYQLRPWIAFPVEIGLCALSLLIMIPSALAIFPQKNSMKPELLKIYPEEYEIFREKMGQRKYTDFVYYNKGL